MQATGTNPPPPATPPAASAASDRIVNAARRHFMEHGFRGVTMDDLAAELGMSKKTLYAHFPTKDDLVKAVLAAKFAEVDAELREVTRGGPANFPEALAGLLAVVQRHAAELQPAFVRDMRRSAPELFGLVEQRRAGLIQKYIGRLMEQGQKSGMVRKDVPPRVIVEVLLAATNAIVNPARVAELGITPATGFESVIRVVLEGALTPRGRARS